MNIPQPIAEWLDSQTGLNFVVTVGSIALLIWGFWKFVKAAFPSVKRAIQFLEALGKLPDFMTSAAERLDAQEEIMQDVKHEVLPNSGKSMRDEQITMGLRLEKVEAKMSKDYTRIKAIEDELRIREQRGIGIPTSTVSPRLNALPSRIPSHRPTSEDVDIEDTQQYPPPFPANE